MRNLSHLFIITLLFLLSSCGDAPAPVGLTCEGMLQPLGLDNASPHFSWKAAQGSMAHQSAYQIQVASSKEALEKGQADLWDSGRIVSDDQIMIPYEGKELSSRTLCYWRVRTWDDKSEASSWSQSALFSIGILEKDVMEGQYIGAFAYDGNSALLKKEFFISDKGDKAFLYVNSLGYHEAYLNGQKVTDAVLVPAVTQMDKRSLIVTYDVSPLIKDGANTLVLWTGSGWYKKETFQSAYGGALVRAELDILNNGTWNCVEKTDQSWSATLSGYQDLGSWLPWQFVGERIQASMVPSSLEKDFLGTLSWQNVEVAEITDIKATQQMCEQNVIVEDVPAVSVTQLDKDSWFIDFGKTMNAQVEIALPCLQKDWEVTATFSDIRNEDGSFSEMDKDIYVSSGNPLGDTFKNKFNHHCFRYVILRNLPLSPIREKSFAHRFHTDYSPAGTFQSSDEDINRIHDMIVYTMSNLAFSGYMVDCAHIERLGYGGDGNASTLSLENAFNVAPLYQNWLQAWRDAQKDDGSMPHTAPNPYAAGGGPYWCGFIVQAPWRTWMAYQDDRQLQACYPSMLSWLEYVDAYSVDGLLKRWPDTVYRNWYLGDWATPEGVDVTDPESIDLTNNCSLLQCYKELEEIARYLGKEADAQKFGLRLQELRKKVHETFYHPEEGIYGKGCQLDMIYPLLTGAVPEDLVDNVREKLMERSRTVYNGHIGVGLVGVPVLTEWATLAKEPDFVYGMLKKKDYPGYLFMLESGATGTWENWDSERSHLHNCFNGIGSWFYQALGGIIPLDPGYRTTLIEPQAPQGIDWVDVTRETPYGTIAVSWKTTQDGHTLHMTIPSGITVKSFGGTYGPGTYDITF